MIFLIIALLLIWFCPGDKLVVPDLTTRDNDHCWSIKLETCWTRRYNRLDDAGPWENALNSIFKYVRLLEDRPMSLKCFGYLPRHLTDKKDNTSAANGSVIFISTLYRSHANYIGSSPSPNSSEVSCHPTSTRPWWHETSGWKETHWSTTKAFTAQFV